MRVEAFASRGSSIAFGTPPIEGIVGSIEAANTNARHTSSRQKTGRTTSTGLDRLGPLRNSSPPAASLTPEHNLGQNKPDKPASYLSPSTALSNLGASHDGAPTSPPSPPPPERCCNPPAHVRQLHPTEMQSAHGDSGGIPDCRLDGAIHPTSSGHETFAVGRRRRETVSYDARGHVICVQATSCVD